MTSDLLKPTPGAYKNRRGWLIAFGVVEILIAFFNLMMGLMVLVVSHMRIPNLPEQDSMFPGITILVAVFYCGIAAVFLAIGVGSIRCKNWARIAMLVVSSLWLCVGVLATSTLLLMVPSSKLQQAPEARHTAFVVLIATMGFLTVVMPAVFLVFYTRKSVKATFLSLAEGQVPALTDTEPPASKVPVPVIILAIWQGIGVLAVFGFLWFRATVVFGAVLHGPAVFLVVLLHSAVSGYAAWLIYRRKLLGWWIALFNALFWPASTITTFAGHDALQIYRELGVGEQQMKALQQFPQLQSMVSLATLPGMAALLALLLYTKKFFSRSGTEAASGSLPSQAIPPATHQ